MKHGLEHYVSKLLIVLWSLFLVIGSVALVAWVIKLFFKVMGVM